MADYQHIRTTRDGDVLAITLARPERLNAMSPAMADEIRHAVGHLDGARCVLISGEGKGFCSGADLAANTSGQSVAGGQGAYERMVESYNPMLRDIVGLSVPVVCAVNGPAAGIGCSLALTADLCIAAEGAYFLQAFVNIGLVPDGGASWLLPRLVGRARATEMMMLGEKLPAEKAFDWGLIHKVVPADTLADEAQSLAQRLATGPTVALGLMKANIARSLEEDYSASLQLEAEAQQQAGDSADAMEGIGAFLQKRKANFAGR